MRIDEDLYRSTILKGKIYIDSVPRGAHVYLIQDNGKEDHKELGIKVLPTGFAGEKPVFEEGALSNGLAVRWSGSPWLSQSVACVGWWLK